MNSLACGDALAYIGILPIEGPCSFGVGTDVADELAGEITDGSEYAARDDLSLNAREPDLHLVEPG